MNIVLSRIAHFLYKVNVNCKLRFQVLTGSDLMTLFYSVNLHVDVLADNTVTA